MGLLIPARVFGLIAPDFVGKVGGLLLVSCCWRFIPCFGSEHRRLARSLKEQGYLQGHATNLGSFSPEESPFKFHQQAYFIIREAGTLHILCPSKLMAAACQLPIMIRSMSSLACSIEF